MPARQSRGASRNTCRPARRQNRPVPGSNGPRPAWRPSRAAAPHQRRHQNRPGCARDEEQRVAQALDDCGRGQLGRHHEAGRQQRADDGGRRSQHAQQAAQGAAQEGQRQQQPQMGRAHAGQQAIHTAGQSSASMRPRVVATGRRDRRSRPRMPRWRSSPAGVHRAARPGSPAPRWWRRPAGRPARGCGARRRARERGGSQAAASFRKGARRARGAHPTMPGRPPMRLLWQVIANFAATCRYGYTSVTFAPRGRKIIWRNRRKSPKNVSVTTPNRRPAQFCVGVHVQCVSDRARTARPRIRDASGAQT